MAEIKNTENTEKKSNMKEVFIPLDQLNPKEDTLPVSVNGKTYLVKRGMSVYVPAEVAEILKFKRLTLR